MLSTVFLICALVGGGILLVQTVMLFIGLGAEDVDLDAPDDIDFDVDADIDLDADAMDVDDLAEAGHASTISVFRVLSIRSVVAALTFFGLAGLVGQRSSLPAPMVVVVAVAAGLGAMYLVYWAMKAMRKLRAEGTVRIQRAVGRPATVYLRIPPHKSGTGKIQFSLQNRTMEYLAITPGDALPTGAKVVVTGIVTSDTVEVESALESERNDHD